METDNDLPLLQAIAQRRDEAAFETLLQRHQRATFGLAMALTGRWDRAEEAVQEAMLKVWRAAGTFQPREGTTVRSWLLRVVAREGLMLLRKERQERKRKPEEKGSMTMGAAAEETGETLETKEALASMQAALLKLSPPDRQLVALAYGAEMSHREIAKELAIPSRAISRRLQEVLSGLRANLKEAGFAAALPLAQPHELGAAILASFEPPPGLAAGIQGRLAEAGGEAVKILSRRTAAASRRAVMLKTGTGPWVAVGLAAVCAGGAWWWTRAPGAPAEQPPLATPVEPPATPVAVPQAAQAPSFEACTHLALDFSPGPYEGLRLLQGEWRWQMVPDLKRGEMWVPNDPRPTVFALPVLTLKRPFKITAVMNNAGRTGRAGIDALWATEQKLCGYRFWLDRYDRPGRVAIHEIYFFGAHVVNRLGGHVSMVQEYKQPFPGDRVFISVKNVSVLEVSYDLLGTDEKDEHGIPAALRDVPALIAKMGKTPKVIPDDPIEPEFWRRADREPGPFWRKTDKEPSPE